MNKLSNRKKQRPKVAPKQAKHSASTRSRRVSRKPKSVRTPRDASDYVCDAHSSQCAKCSYVSTTTASVHLSCNYMLIEGHMRGCPVKNCTRFTTKQFRGIRKWLMYY